ncbi:hypothetical protein Ddc_14429 [Ditylenchus destructor]|nr:hypothetical protein Ddc_14429 [Ditylenchus destructor]
MSSSGVKLSIAVLALLVLGSCSANSVLFKDFASLTGTFGLNGHTLCDDCNERIAIWDEIWPYEMPPDFDTPEKLAEKIKKKFPSTEAKKMSQSAGLDEKQDANLENEAQIEPRSSKDESDSRTSTIATLDNGTLVEAFKFVNYCQLATNSLVSKRFRDLIRTNRHRLALLHVTNLCMRNPKPIFPIFGIKPIKIFGKELSPEEYNEWVIRNNYSKQIPLEYRDAVSIRYERDLYGLEAEVEYKDPALCPVSGRVIDFNAEVELNNENWPLFQHFVRLLTDSFIYIRSLELTRQIDDLNLLLQYRGRLQCEKLKLNLEDNPTQKFFSWIKNYVCCTEFQMTNISLFWLACEGHCDSELLDFFLTGAHCASEIKIKYPDPSKVIIGFVQKFIDFKHCDEYQVVESIECNGQSIKSVGELKHKYATFIVKEENDNHKTYHTFEFINYEIRKKLKLTAKINHIAVLSLDIYSSYFVLQIENL